MSYSSAKRQSSVSVAVPFAGAFVLRRRRRRFIADNAPVLRRGRLVLVREPVVAFAAAFVAVRGRGRRRRELRRRTRLFAAALALPPPPLRRLPLLPFALIVIGGEPLSRLCTPAPLPASAPAPFRAPAAAPFGREELLDAEDGPDPGLRARSADERGVEPDDALERCAAVLVAVRVGEELVRKVERVADELGVVRVAADVVRRVVRVLDGEEERARGLHHVAVLFAEKDGAVGAARDAHRVLLQPPPVQLEKINQELPEVVLGRVALWVLPQKTDEHDEERVRPNPAAVHLVHVALLQKSLDDERQRPQSSVTRHLLPHKHSRGRTVRHVEGDVKLKPGLRLLKLDDWHARLGDELDVLRQPAPRERHRKRLEPVRRVGAARVQNDGVNVRGRQVEPGGEGAKQLEPRFRPDPAHELLHARHGRAARGRLLRGGLHEATKVNHLEVQLQQRRPQRPRAPRARRLHPGWDVLRARSVRIRRRRRSRRWLSSCC
mmetsp:Transcript_13653/g.44922  ORF Transcript_13653/g.44922 Transcript_13653/m.44922 type:complete len:493 (-) Transcript_13653:1579-3057(-)